MSTFSRIADWVYSLNPYALTCLVVVMGMLLLVLAGLSWLFIYGAMSGAGEGSPEEADDACAWCEPGDARGICPEHSAEMAEQAREISREEGKA